MKVSLSISQADPSALGMCDMGLESLSEQASPLLFSSHTNLLMELRSSSSLSVGLSMQRRLQYIHEYVNIAELYRQALAALEFTKEPIPIMRYHLRTFFSEYSKHDPFYDRAGDTNKGTRSSTEAAAAEAQESSDDRIGRLLLMGTRSKSELQKQCDAYFWEGGRWPK